MAVTFPATVGTAAVVILPAQPFATPGSQSVVVSNTGSTAMFIGGANVSGAANGVEVPANSSLPLPQAANGGPIYAISTGTGTTAVVGIF